MRPSSSPAIEVQNTVSPIRWCGVASALTCSSMPRSRKISIVRWLVMCALGVFAVHRYLVIIMLSTPRLDRNSAADPPAGPEPTTSTSVLTTSEEGSAAGATPSSNVAIVTIPLICCLPARAVCLLYTSDAADEEDSVDLGGRRIIKK